MSDRKQKAKEMAVTLSAKSSRHESRDRVQSIQKKSRLGNTIKLLLAAMLVLGGATAFSLLTQQSLYIRWILLGASILLAVLIIFVWCDTGPKLIRYIKDSITEIKKVVWPAGNEAWRNTFFVLVFTAVMTVFLWLVDTFLVWLLVALSSGK
ncbi:preprotein translocase subunit SecE [Eikenella sp. S3360]|uniref:Protein translocase subunit SecE n=1 Tax=Eikenella glucosivorans TaxID=2766967 RepID=A0ABS0NCH5_9NEIS|nr:preprotein translocase subunit SecE [Eikenella glucosivorans]MBH5329965.1 preprotein translocase subunit SecE [Eikenella glucosivorans]